MSSNAAYMQRYRASRPDYVAHEKLRRRAQDKALYRLRAEYPTKYKRYFDDELAILESDNNGEK